MELRSSETFWNYGPWNYSETPMYEHPALNSEHSCMQRQPGLSCTTTPWLTVLCSCEVARLVDVYESQECVVLLSGTGGRVPSCVHLFSSICIQGKDWALMFCTSLSSTPVLPGPIPGLVPQIHPRGENGWVRTGAFSDPRGDLPPCRDTVRSSWPW